jgi:hypothetical protein
LLDLTAHERGKVRRHAIQPMDRIIGPHHPIDEPTGFTSRNIDPYC